jgi:5-methylcytosine-specific restriction enzyme A
MRNPPWSREELILALDLYLRHHARGPNDSQVVALSETLNRFRIHPERTDAERFRNPNGVYMKLQNFRRLDPKYPGVGLTRGNKLEEVVWREYVGEPKKLRRKVEELERSASSSHVAAPERHEHRTVRLDPDLAEAFPNDEMVNRVLREVLGVAERLRR